MTMCKVCIVTGRVQGVFFRASTQQQARRLGVTGYAKNLPDGNVEALVCGDHSALDELTSWLWQGPAAAGVSDVRCTSIELQEVPIDFSTR